MTLTSKGIFIFLLTYMNAGQHMVKTVM